MMAEERRFIRNELNQAYVKHLHPPDDENTLIQKGRKGYISLQSFAVPFCETY